MENISNRFLFTGVKAEDYKKTPKKYVRFITRFEEKNFTKLKKVFGEKFNFTKKPQEFDRDKTELYKYDVMPYDNTTARDMISCISVIVCKPDQVDTIKNMITQNFINVSFKTANAQSITLTIDIPETERGIWKTINQTDIEFPIGIVSLGRYTDKTGLTHMYLKKCGIPHKIFVEPQEYENYAKWTSSEYLVVGEDFSKQNMGSTPMRNFILEYYKNLGYKRCWMLDDNIVGYHRLYGGIKNYIESTMIFSSIEQYIKQYDNIGAVSHNFSPFIREGDCRAVLVENGKSFSSMCLLTDGLRFKHKYQEDHFISIEYLTKGFRNLCFNNILYMKNTSGTCAGGNMVSLYNGDDGYTKKAKYMYNTLENMIEKREIKLKDNTHIDDFCKQDKTMKSKTLHYKIDYKNLDVNPPVSHKPEVVYEKWNKSFFYLSVTQTCKVKPEPELKSRWFVGKMLTAEDVEYLNSKDV